MSKPETNDANNNTTGHTSTNITFQVTKLDREKRLSAYSSRQQTGCTIWFTGLSSSGKTTISFALEEYFNTHLKVATYCLDGDNIRFGLNSNLGFSPEDRCENIRRIGEVSKLFADAGLVCLSSFISPYEADRDLVRQTHKKGGLPFICVYVHTPLEVCEQRDVKGLYKKARSGMIKDFTGIHTVFEEPFEPEITINTTELDIKQSVQKIVKYLEDNNIMKKKETNSVALTNGDYKSRELFVAKADEANLRAKAATMHKVEMNTIECQWAQVLSEGWAHPMRGFMREDEYLRCLHFNTIKNDSMQNEHINQSVAIVMSLYDKQREQILADKATSICLTYQGKEVAVLSDIDIFGHRKEERCARQFGLYHAGHPYQKYIIEECGDWLVGGDLHVFERITWGDGLDQYRLTPVELQQRFEKMNADAVFAFQLRNPIHNGHALLMKDTRKFLLGEGYKNPVLLLHPLGGWTKEDDVPLNVRIEQHKAVLNDGHYLDNDSTVMAIFPSPMMYAGPTEVQWHAKTRMNAGAKYYIVGRDPAGMAHPGTKSDIYDATHGSRVLQMSPGLETLKIVPFKVAAYNKEKKTMDYFNPAKATDFEFISGTKMRKFAREGVMPPKGFMVDDAWTVVSNYYKSLNKQ